MRRWVSIGVAALIVTVALAWAPAAVHAGGYRVAAVWGEAGHGRGELWIPKGVAVAADGSVLVVENANDTLIKYSASGALLDVWGGLGSAPGRLRGPSWMAIGPDGTVYVADSGNQRVQRFSPSGRYLGQWGRWGDGPGEFNFPRGIDVAADGTVYVVDQHNFRIQVFTARGRFLRLWGGRGEGPGRFLAPKDLAVGDDGRVYVTDAGTHRVQVFTAQGRRLFGFGGRGSELGRLRAPRGIDLDARGHVFVADMGNRRVQEFTARGAPVRAWGCEGVLPGMFQGLRGLALAPDGSVVVADTLNRRIQRFVRDPSDDGTPPATSSVQPAGWSRAPLAVTLAAADDGAGVAATYASVNARLFRPVDRPIALDDQGRYVLRFFSVDAAANQELPRRLVFRLDWTAPVVRLGTSEPLRAAAGERVALRFTVGDALSSVCRVSLRLERDGDRLWGKSLDWVPAAPPGRALQVAVPAPASAGVYLLRITAEDRAGNVRRRTRELVVRSVDRW